MFESIHREWMESVQLVFDYFCERTPRSFVETRGTSLVWNYKYAGGRGVPTEAILSRSCGAGRNGTGSLYHRQLRGWRLGALVLGCVAVHGRLRSGVLV